VSQGEGNQPRLLGTIRYLDSYANANYNALQVHAQKRYSRGFTAGVANSLASFFFVSKTQ
jgi:hypothetical protein